jgi:hypothetical protein
VQLPLMIRRVVAAAAAPRVRQEALQLDAAGRPGAALGSAPESEVVLGAADPGATVFEVAAVVIGVPVAPIGLPEGVEVAAVGVPAVVVPFGLHAGVEAAAVGAPAVPAPFGLHAGVEAAAAGVPAVLAPFGLHAGVEAAAADAAVAVPFGLLEAAAHGVPEPPAA